MCDKLHLKHTCSAIGALSSGNPPPPAFAGYPVPVPAVPAPVPGVSYDKDGFMQRSSANDDYEKKVEMFLQRVGKGLVIYLNC